MMMTLIRAAFCCLGILLTSNLSAQKLDHYDLILFQVSKKPDSTWQIQSPQFLSAFNRGGYNNQPNFFSAQEIYLTAQLADDTTQTEIVALDLLKKTMTHVTDTEATSEYSPTLMPGGKRFSAVRVEEDGVQRLWSFPLDRSDSGRPELGQVSGVGYHCWLRDTLVAFFIVGEGENPHSLQVAGPKTKRPTRIVNDIGRCLLKTSQGKLAFVQKVTDQTWFLKIWDPVTQYTEIIVKMPEKCEDFAILNDGAFLCGQGAKLWIYKPGTNTAWMPIADLKKYGVTQISRLALSKEGRLVVVVQ